jgi:hypothetical protein
MRIFVCVFLMAALSFCALAADVSGKWTGTFTSGDGGNGGVLAVFKQAGTSVTGTAGPEEQQWPIQNGRMEGDKVTFEVKSADDGTVYKCQLTLAGDTLKGDVTATREGQVMKGRLDLTRAK